MNRKTVYVSSTYEDLKELRSAVHDTLYKIGYYCIAMEAYVASTKRPLDECLNDVKKSDIYVGLVGWRYGFIPKANNPKGLSITELEYQCAVDHGKDCYIFLLREGTWWPPEYIDDSRRKVRLFRKTLEINHLVSYFKNADQLSSELAIALGWSTRVPRPARLSKMPKPLTTVDFVGRESELQSLKEYFLDDKTAVVAITGPSGIGKSHLVSEFLEQLGRANHAHDRCQWRYAWSFYNQDTQSVENSSSEFFSDVLRHYGFDAWYVSEMQRAATLVNLVCGEKSLLVLDGVDPLLREEREEAESSAFRDTAMMSFIVKLCDEAERSKSHQGLVIVTSRRPLFDHGKYNRAYAEIRLGFLQEREGRDLLQKLLPPNSTRNNDIDTFDVSRKTGGQPLALALLGRVLAKEFQDNIIKGVDVFSQQSAPHNDWVFKAGPRHSNSIVSFVILGKWKIVNIHRFMTRACKPLSNQVYSRLLGDRNECDEWSQPDVLLEESRRPAQTQQWDAARLR